MDHLSPAVALPSSLDIGPLPGLGLVGVDMDGTLLVEHALPASIGPLLEQVRRRGIVLCPASGRQLANLRRHFPDEGPHLAFAAENGALVVHDGEVVSTTCLDHDAAVRAVGTVRALAGSGADVGLVVCGVTSAYVERTDRAFLDEVERYYARLEVVDDLAAVADDVLKVAAYDFGQVAGSTASAIRDVLGDQQVVVSGEHWLDVMDPGVSKGVAIRALQRRLGIGPEQTLAFGDYLNDVQLLGAAGYPVAVENAHPALFEHARWVAPGPEDDGVARTLAVVLGLG